jgi:hypothetical protein
VKFTCERVAIRIGTNIAIRAWRSPQYVKAMEASFPPDRWPASQVCEPDGTVRFVLNDGTEIHQLPPPEPFCGSVRNRSEPEKPACPMKSAQS